MKALLSLVCAALFVCSTVFADEPTDLDNSLHINTRIEFQLRTGQRYLTYVKDNDKAAFNQLVVMLVDPAKTHIMVPATNSDGRHIGDFVLLKSEIVAVSRRMIFERVNEGDKKMLYRLLDKDPNSGNTDEKDSK